jgi:hypothetical protein
MTPTTDPAMLANQTPDCVVTQTHVNRPATSCPRPPRHPHQRLHQSRLLVGGPNTHQTCGKRAHRPTSSTGGPKSRLAMDKTHCLYQTRRGALVPASDSDALAGDIVRRALVATLVLLTSCSAAVDKREFLLELVSLCAEANAELAGVDPVVNPVVDLLRVPAERGDEHGHVAVALEASGRLRPRRPMTTSRSSWPQCWRWSCISRSTSRSSSASSRASCRPSSTSRQRPTSARSRRCWPPQGFDATSSTRRASRARTTARPSTARSGREATSTSRSSVRCARSTR